MAFTGRGEYPFMGCPDEKECQIHLVLSPFFFFSAVVANIEKQKLAVTGSAVVLLLVDFLNQESHWLPRGGDALQ